MTLIFDTETTGIPRRGAPPSDTASWPRVVQIAWLVLDESGREVRSRCHIVRPQGFEIPADAVRVHGITTERALREGVDLRHALLAFGEELSAATTIVAHNAEFDAGTLDAEYHRLGWKKGPLGARPILCTMRAATNLCRIPGGRHGAYKWPRLEELHAFLFGQAPPVTHDALADARACARCYLELRRRGFFAAPGAMPAKEPDSDQELFDEIYALADRCPWYDTSGFVDDVYDQWQERGFLTPRQREALENVRDKLEERAP